MSTSEERRELKICLRTALEGALELDKLIENLSDPEASEKNTYQDILSAFDRARVLLRMNINRSFVISDGIGALFPVPLRLERR